MEPERDDHRAGERREVDEPLGALGDGVAEAVGQHQPSLGVGVVDLDRLAVGRRDDVPGLDRAAARQVLGGAHDRHQPHRQAAGAAIAAIASITAAPPDMSNFISAIFGPGFSEMPPLSNVTALPTKPSVGRAPAAAGPS